MRRYTAFAINTSSYSHYGPWGVSAYDAFSSGYTSLFAPVFHERFPAEVFAGVLEQGGVPETPGMSSEEADIALAAEIGAFIDAWDESHDSPYPTKDGRYPSAHAMAGWFLAARPKQQAA